jgi:RNA polymerase sigma-B factor
MFRRVMTLDEQSIEYKRQRDVIIERCLPLADHIAHRFRSRGEQLEDLVQVARMGRQFQAVNRFDAEHGADLLAFAVPTMMGEVRRYFRDHGWSVKVPRRMKELGPQLNRARDDLSQRLGRAPTASEIASHLGIDHEEVVQAQIASTAYSTLASDAPARGQATTTADDRSVTASEI